MYSVKWRNVIIIFFLFTIVNLVNQEEPLHAESGQVATANDYGLILNQPQRLLTGGDICSSATSLTTAIPAFTCNSTAYSDDAMGIATATGSGFPKASCWASSDTGSTNDRWYVWTNDSGFDVNFRVSTDDAA